MKFFPDINGTAEIVLAVDMKSLQNGFPALSVLSPVISSDTRKKSHLTNFIRCRFNGRLR